jgi:prepilin-type processing-associated H-X9-DG protein
MDEEAKSRGGWLHIRRQMGIHCKLEIGATIVCLVLSIGGCRPRNSPQSEATKLSCQGQIRSAAYCVFEYRSTHNGQFPRTLEDAVAPEAGAGMIDRLTSCPAKGAVARYVYLNWSLLTTNLDVPKAYPLLYESRMDRHGNGLNIALMDGSAFWDEDARWITAFVTNHPEYSLRVPK